MALASQKNQPLVKVICVACAKTADRNCEFCKGARFHLWDSQTHLCYNCDGKPLIMNDSDGNEIHVRRDPNLQKAPRKLPVHAMLTAIENWVSESPVRKWRLTLDDEGWHASIWFNRFKKNRVDTSDAHLALCVERSYREIIQSSTSQ